MDKTMMEKNVSNQITQLQDQEKRRKNHKLC